MTREEHRLFRDLLVLSMMGETSPEEEAVLAALKRKLEEDWKVTRLLGTSLVALDREE
jgi:hypothetical protein